MAEKQKNKREKKKEKKKKSKVLKRILILLLLVLIILIAGITYKVQKNGGGLQGLLSTLVGHDEETLKNLEQIQVLLMGVSTDNGGKLTDTIIVATYDPKNQKASLLSIPRDTFVGKNPQTGTGSDKINALYQKSPEKTLEKVNEITGLNIKYYMVVDNQALIKLVDVIGGVDFYVPIDMVYDDPSQDLHINLKEGQQKLDGDKAEQLLRYRHGNLDRKTGKYLGTYPEEYGGNDYGRMRTQREFMIETAKQTLKAKNILKVKEIIDIAYEYVETNLSVSVIKDYVPYAVNIDINNIQSAVLPGASYGPSTTPSYPLWFFVADKKETAKLIEELYGTNDSSDEDSNEATNKNNTTNSNTTNTTNTSKNNTSSNNTSTSNTSSGQISKTEAGKIKIEILNGSDSTATLTKVKKALTAKGYKVTKTTTTTSTPKTTLINKSDVDTKITDYIKDILGVGTVSSSSVSSSNVDVTIIIGKDYE